MPIKITMPALSPTMEEGNLSKWNVKEGDKVSSGDVIAEIETDKATMEVEAVDEGTIAKIVVPAETQGVKVNTLIAILAEEGEDPAEAVKIIEKDVQVPSVQDLGAKESADTKVLEVSRIQESGQKEKGSDNVRLFASPLARRLAAQKNLDLSRITGTGPRGRIIKRDVEHALSESGFRISHLSQTGQSEVKGFSDEQIIKLFKESEYTFTAHDNMRKTIAKRLADSKRTVPHFYVTADCALDALLELRAKLNASAQIWERSEDSESSYRLSVNDMVIKAVALALKAVPNANVSWLEGGMLHHKHCDVGVAVSIPNGLITPIIRHAEEKSLSTISYEMKDLSRRAREHKLKVEEYQGGTTAVSNMGMYGVKEFSAILNPPNATIFAIGAGEQRAVVRNGALEVATVMSVVLSVDHRAIDGAVAAELLQAFKRIIENPLSMLI